MARHPALFVVIVFLFAACDEAATFDPESRHCRAALGWMTKGIGGVEEIERRTWEAADRINVTIVYDLRPEGGGRSRHFFHCRYPLPDPGQSARRRAWASEIEMSGTKLSERQIQTINTTISLIGERPGDAGNQK